MRGCLCMRIIRTLVYVNLRQSKAATSEARLTNQIGHLFALEIDIYIYIYGTALLTPEDVVQHITGLNLNKSFFLKTKQLQSKNP